jgi:hypothetical protein
MGRTFWLVLAGFLLVALVSLLLSNDACGCAKFSPTSVTAPGG